jgi:hypothetical protein
MSRVGLPTGEKAIYIRVQQEHEGIAESDVSSTHVDKTVHGVMGSLHVREVTHCSIISLVQYSRSHIISLSIRRKWSTNNRSIDYGWRICGVARTISVRICSRDIKSVSPEGTYGVLPGRSDRGIDRTAVAHEFPYWATGVIKQVQRSSKSSAKIRIGNVSGILCPIPIVQGKLRIDLPEHQLQPVDDLSMPGQEFRAVVHMCRLMDFILFEPLAYPSCQIYPARRTVPLVTASLLVPGNFWRFNSSSASRSSFRSAGSTDAMLRLIPSPSAIATSNCKNQDFRFGQQTTVATTLTPRRRGCGSNPRQFVRHSHPSRSLSGRMRVGV